jgi:hypothetical protein
MLKDVNSPPTVFPRRLHDAQDALIGVMFRSCWR